MQYIVQMSGVPGSGKSTIATPLATEIDALVFDHDETKSTIMSKQVSPDRAGQASYEIIKLLARKFAHRGHNIVIDSPCLYSDLLSFGQQLALETGARYCYIECRLDDLEELTRRIRQRTSMPSQNKNGPLDDELIEHREEQGKNAKDLFLNWAESMKRPDQYLVLDSTETVDKNLRFALNYLRNGV